MASGSGDRRRAARLLIRVEDGAFASRLLASGSRRGVRARVLGVLRWQRRIDHELRRWLKRPLEGLDAEVRAALRIGVFERRFLDVPPAVATDAMVRLTRGLGTSSAAGMVNAVLRRALAGEPSADLPSDVECSHPEWIWRRWCAAFGPQAAETAMSSAQEPAPPWVWFHDASVRRAVEREGTVLSGHPWCPETWTADGDPSALLNRVASGELVVQDPSSQLVARLAVDACGGRGRAIDACAAPGGKTALLARLGSWDRLVAADVDPAKLERLRRRVDGAGMVIADAARPAVTDSAWDLVLLDAPCSGTGTFRRHPELKWRLVRRAVEAAAERQRAMIEASLELLAPNGILVYATCSIEPEENEAHFDELPGNLERADLSEHLPHGVPWFTTDAGGIRILPHEWGDGFTVHALRRLE